MKRNFENCNKKNLFDNYHHYFPLYVGKTKNFCNRYKHFKNSLKSGATAPHVFGGDLNQFLSKSKLINSQPMKMCLVAFYTNSEDKAKCIEHFILKHPNFCKIFNDEDGDCLGIQKIKRIAEDIEKEAKKIIQKAQKIIPKPEEIIQKAQEINNKVEEITKAEKAEDIEEILKTIKIKAGEIKDKAKQIRNIGKKAEDIEEIIKNIEKEIKEKSEEIINAIQIANKIIDTIKKLQSCPWYSQKTDI